jgi:hypothetical protein
MANTTLRELHLAQEHLIDGPVLFSGTLMQTQSLDDCGIT